MELLKKIDCNASESFVFGEQGLKHLVMYNNGNFDCRQREKIVDVSQLALVI